MALTRQAFERLLAFLDSDRNRAGEKYESIRLKLLKFFEWRRCASPEEHADETIDRVSRRIDEGEEIHASDPSLYFYGVARNVLMEYWEKRRRDRVVRDSMPGFEQPSNDLGRGEFGTPGFEQRFECLERCLQRLSPEGRELIVGYYRGEKHRKIENRKRLADELGIPPNALRIRVHRIRGTLEVCVQDCLKRLEDGPK